jgi:CDP-diacylglycerol--serine O-phosphatidyltransferase
MNQPPYFIVSPNRIDMLTLGGLLLSSLGLLSALNGTLTLSIGLMLSAMFIDMVDGLLARRMKLESEFGRYLDSFCDVFIYLVLPLFILYQFGMKDTLSIIALFAFLVSGILRLARFNILSTVEEAGVLYHLGLQVIWSHLVVVVAFPAWWWFGEKIRYLMAAILLIMSFFMIRNLRFRKPTQYKRLTVLIFSVAAIYFYLHIIGIHTP